MLEVSEYLMSNVILATKKNVILAKIEMFGYCMGKIDFASKIQFD